MELKPNRRLSSAVQLAKEIKLDMAGHWQEATSDGCRRRKMHLLAELDSTLKPAQAKDIEGLKKEADAKTMAAAVRGKRWLPPILRVGRSVGRLRFIELDGRKYP